MAAITVTALDFMPVEVIQQLTLPAAEAITRGQYVRLDTSGNWALGNGTTTGELGNTWGLAADTAPAGVAVTAIIRGMVNIGDGLSALAFDAAVYIGDTDGTLDTAAGTVSRVVGYVVPAWAATTADKLLKIGG